MDAIVTIGALFGLCTFILPVVALFRTFRIGVLEQELTTLKLKVELLENERRERNKATLAQVPPPAKSTGAAPAVAPPPLISSTPPPVAAAREVSVHAASISTTEATPAALPSLPPSAPRVDPPSTAGPVIAPPAASVPAAPRPPPPASTQAQAAIPPTPPKPAFEWERWLGIRGAAAAGAVVLALAMVLFVKYSIEHGWLSPSMRVALGAITAIAALVSSEALRKRFGATSNGLAAAAIVGLYADTWAARGLYQLIPMELAFVLMVLTTAVCALLAVRHHSLLIATLGLAGGFATPFLLSTGSNRPIALFGYVLLLDVAFVIVALKKKWHGIALMALAGTALTQFAWVWRRAEPEQVLLALGILAVFAVLFAVVLNKQQISENRESWLLTRVAAVLLPFCFALYFSVQTSWPLSPLPLAGFLSLLCAAAFWISLEEKLAWLPVSAVSAAAGVLLLRTFTAPASGSPWVWTGALLLLGTVAPLALTLATRRSGDDHQLFDFSVLAKMGLLSGAAFSLLYQRQEPTLLPYAVLGLALAALLYWPALRSPSRVPWALPASGFLALYWAMLVHGAVLFATGVQIDFTLLTLLGVAGLFLALGLRSSQPPQREGTLRAAAVLSVGALFFFAMSRAPSMLEPRSAWAYVVALVALATFAGSSVDRALWLPVTVVASALFAFVSPVKTAGEFFTLASLTAAMALWPLLAGRHLQSARWAIYASALVGAAHFLPLYDGWEKLFGSSAVGGLPLALAIPPLVAMTFILSAFAPHTQEHRRAMTWYGGVALSFVALAIPLQLERHWMWVAWAAQGTALLCLLWPKVNHSGLKYFGLTLLTLAVAGLSLHPLTSSTFFAQGRAMPLLNWTLYSYGVPFVGLWWTASTFARLEKQRSGHEWGLTAVGALALWQGFVWINVTIADIFSRGNVLAYHHVPAQDLSMSVAWAVYALAILAVGMRRDSKGLRWSSLGILLVTLGKVTFYDLGHLTDLYRAASLLGLGVALFLVSIAYQRFVFAKKPSPVPETP